MRYETPTGREIPEELVIDSSPDSSNLGRRVSLRLKYDHTDKKIKLTSSPSLKILNQRDNKAGLIFFTIEVQTLGVTERVSYVIAEFEGMVFGSAHKSDLTLRIRIGKVLRHDNFESDLFAQLLGMSSNADALLAYSRVLAANNNMDLPRAEWDKLSDNPLKQNTGSDSRKWNCGGALMSFGRHYMSGHYTSGATLYYQTPAPNKLARVVFNKDAARRGAERIRTLLSNGNVVQVFVGHHEDLTIVNGRIRPSGNTHFLTLFGCSGSSKQFLFFDPWPGGSILMYKSGILGTVRSLFMGLLEYSEDEGKIRSPTGVGGSHKNYVILEGP